MLSGSLEDGSIIVDAHDSSKVWILLDGVEINCSDDACIQVDQADKVFLTLAEGSENTLISGSAYSDTALSDGTRISLFRHCAQRRYRRRDLCSRRPYDQWQRQSYCDCTVQSWNIR